MASQRVLQSSLPEPSKIGISCDKSQGDNTVDLVKTFGDWHIRQDILYLDHGAFGACPIRVVDEQRHIRQNLEENPHEFFERKYVSAWEASRRSLAGFLHVEPADLVFVPGATHGCNIVIQSLQLQPDDEILTTNHAYSSIVLALNYVAQRDNARLVIADIPLHTSPEDVHQRILACVTSRTRFAVLDHVPSRSGLVFPIKEIVHQLASHSIDTLVDGAHAAGMIDLNITDINAAYYVANCHKWMCTPRGVGFLHVRPDHAHKIKPLVIARSPYVVNKSKYSKLEHSFGWMGTACPSAVLSLRVSIDFLSTVVPGGLDGLMVRNHRLTVIARRVVCKALGIPLPCPDDMIGAMATIPLPDSPGPEQEGMLPIQDILWKEHKIVVPVYAWPAHPKRVIRFSAQAYNTLEQYLWFADCLRSVLYNEQYPPSKNLGKGPLISHQDAECKSMERTSYCGHHMNRGKVANHADTPHRDIKDPEPWSLFLLAKARMRRMLIGRFDTYPVAPYPTAGDNLIHFASANGSGSRHANLEITRMAFMLSCTNRRRIPQLMVACVSRILMTEDVIDGWVQSVQILKHQCRIIVDGIISEMAAPHTPAMFSEDISSFVSRVVPYETEREEENLSLKFWLRALTDFNQGQWSPGRIASFLQIHSFLKDPIGGLCKDSSPQMEVFAMLFTSLQPELEAMQFSSTVWDDIAVQLALESSFMSQPLARHPSYVHFSEDQQLVYSYVNIDQLARSEFASPPIVTGMIECIMTSNAECSIAPIAVAQGYTIYSKHDERPIIIDGNNRITTVSFLRYLATYGIPEAARTDTLADYCQDYGLGPIHFADHCAVLQLLWDDRKDLIDILGASANLQKFRDVRQVPVLVTEESAFFTKSLMAEDEDLLQPVHQSIFATDERLVALPPKMQSHGRAKHFKALPIR